MVTGLTFRNWETSGTVMTFEIIASVACCRFFIGITGDHRSSYRTKVRLQLLRYKPDASRYEVTRPWYT
jgi:hypothetical protein